MARMGIPLIPTMINIENFPGFADAATRFPAYAKHMRDLYERSDETFALALEAGIPLHAGTDAGGYVEHGRIVDEISSLTRTGMDPRAALRARRPRRAGLARRGRLRRRRRAGVRRGSGGGPRAASLPRRPSSGRGASWRDAWRVDPRSRAVLSPRCRRSGRMDGNGRRPAPLSGRGRHWCAGAADPTRAPGARHHDGSAAADAVTHRKEHTAHRGCQDQARPLRQDPRAVLPRRRRRLPHPSRRPGHRAASASTTRRPSRASSTSTPSAPSTGSSVGAQPTESGASRCSRSPATGRSSRACRAPRAP